MALVDDFKARFPEFDPQAVDERLPTYETIWPCYYGGSYENKCDKEIILNLLAHLLYVDNASKQGGSVKPVQSRSAGSVSISYGTRAQQDSNSDFFSMSKYGQRYLFLTAKNIGGFFV